MVLRRMCAALLALACAWGMALAQGADGYSVEDVLGTWQLVEYSVGAEDYAADDLKERGEYVTLNADGSATGTRYGEQADGSWTLDDGSVLLSMYGREQALSYDGAALTLSEGEVSARYVRDTSALYALKYDGAQAQAMCNLMSGGLFVRAGDALYGLSWSGSGAAMLAVRTLTGDEQVAGAARALDENCIARGLNIDGDRLYYVREGLDGKSGICALNVQEGGAPELLLEGEYSGLQLSGERLYCLKADGQLLSCALDGSDVRAIEGIEAQCAYLLDADWLLYQSAQGAGALRAYRLSDGHDVALDYEHGYLPVLHGGYLYYFSDMTDADVTRFCRLELATLEVERTSGRCGAYLAVNSDTFFTANGYKLNRLDAWWTLQNASTEQLDSAPVYADDEYLISLEYLDGVAARVSIERLEDGAALRTN